jgi:hypothetical protein
MKAVPSSATKCQSSVQQTVLEDPFHVHIVFLDRSEMVFRAVLGSSPPRVVGGEESIAHQLKCQTRNFVYLAAGVLIQFNDDSSCTLNFGRRIATSPWRKIASKGYGMTAAMDSAAGYVTPNA